VGRCKQKQRGLRGLLYRWPSITEWEVHITAQGPLSLKWPILCRVGRWTLVYHTIYSLHIQYCFVLKFRCSTIISPTEV